LSCGLELLSSPLIGQNINICSDSRAAIPALSAEKVSSRLVVECKTILETLSLKNNIRLIWVPGHYDVPGNEEADRLARFGAQVTPIGPEPFVGISNFDKLSLKTN